MIKKLTILLLFLFLKNVVYAENNKKISIAIMEFSANNTKEGFGKASVDMLSERLFSSKLFTLMEKNQMHRIARHNGFKEFDLLDPLQITKLGRLLKVDKILTGSITYLDSYIVDVKILNVTTGEIEFEVKRKIRVIEKLEDAIDDISISIERHYIGYYNISGNFDISVEMHYLYPYGTLDGIVDPGYGILAIMKLNSPLENPFDFQLITGCYDFNSGKSSIDYFYMLPLYLSASCRIKPGRNISIIPSAGAGYVFTKISCDNSDNTDNLYWDNKSFYYNPSFVIRSEIDILLHDRWYLVFTPQYNVFFDKGRIGQFASFGLGLKMIF